MIGASPDFSKSQTKAGIPGRVALLEDLHALLLALLDTLPGGPRTTRLSGADSRRIVNTVLDQYPNTVPDWRSSQPIDWLPIFDGLNTLVRNALELQVPHAFNQSPADFPEDLLDLSDLEQSKYAHPLAVWLERCYTLFCRIDLRGIEILFLRLEGYEARDIAGQLDTGLRQVLWIIGELRIAWEASINTND